MCLSFLTRVIIATIIITKVNRSLYVMYIRTTPFARLETDGMTALPAALISILYYQRANRLDLNRVKTIFMLKVKNIVYNSIIVE